MGTPLVGEVIAAIDGHDAIPLRLLAASWIA